MNSNRVITFAVLPWSVDRLALAARKILGSTASSRGSVSAPVLRTKWRNSTLHIDVMLPLGSVPE